MPRTSLTLAVCVCLASALSGCVNLKPVADPAHFYVLSAQLGTRPAAVVGQSNLAVGVGALEIPSYLLDRRIAVGVGAHEVRYLENVRWAERLDRGMQRVIAANLGALLPSDRVLLSAWRREEVCAEVYVSIGRFESDELGRVVLEAHWRITSPGAETPWRADHLLVTRQGPSFRADPEAAVDALNHALADLSQQITADLRPIPQRAMVAKPAAGL